MTAKNDITQSRVRELFDYHPDGYLIWKARPIEDFKNKRAHGMWNTRYAGKKAGRKNTNSEYIYVAINHQLYSAHRIIFLYHYGYEPEFIDHINHIKNDNQIENLRSVTYSENYKNLSMSKNNTSGFVGVRFVAKRKKWLASINIDARNVFLGYYDIKEEAIAARQAANIKYGFHENHGKTYAEIHATKPCSNNEAPGS